MALLRVVLPNDYVPVGTYLETGDDGFAERVRTQQQNGRLGVGSFYGVAVPEKVIRPFAVKVLRRGFDSRGALATWKRPHSGRF